MKNTRVSAARSRVLSVFGGPVCPLEGDPCGSGVPDGCRLNAPHAAESVDDLGVGVKEKIFAVDDAAVIAPWADVSVT